VVGHHRRDVARRSDRSFVNFLKKAEHHVVEHQGVETQLLQLILDGKATTFLARVLKGEYLSAEEIQDNGYKAEKVLEHLLAACAWSTLEHVIGRQAKDPERYPASKFLQTLVSTDKSPHPVVNIAKPYAKLFGFDRVIESWRKEPEDTSRGEPKFTNIFPDVFKPDNESSQVEGSQCQGQPPLSGGHVRLLVRGMGDGGSKHRRFSIIPDIWAARRGLHLDASELSLVILPRNLKPGISPSGCSQSPAAKRV
jgi:hypothetical protein